MAEARLEDLGSGLAPVTDGWFVVNVRDAEWWFAESRGARCPFENEYGDAPVEFAQLGINVTVLEPGQTSLYHAEANQEAFLVLSGACALIVEGEERRLRPWDFFHAPPWIEHAFAGAGEEPCVILMVGARTSPEVRYPRSEFAARYGASVAEETSDWRQAYANVELFRRERPPHWARLPWTSLAAVSAGVALLFGAGCGSQQTPKSVVPSHDCLTAWNADGNERNRADLAERGFTIGSVARAMMFGDPAPGGTATESESCGYLFHSDKRFISYTGDWRGDNVVWTNLLGRHGPWTAIQQQSRPDDVRVLDDGRIAKR